MHQVGYCYSSMESALKMLRTRQVWFTDLRFLNDRTEYKAGFKIVQDICREQFPDLLKPLATVAPRRMNDNFLRLVRSFCINGDSLSLWRGYGDHGRGAAVGYSMPALEQYCLFDRYLHLGAPVQGAPKTFRVTYAQQEFRDAILTRLHAHRAVVHAAPAEQKREVEDIRHRLIAMEISRLCSLYKKNSFEEEREIRGLIEVDSQTSAYELKLRRIRSKLATYVTVSADFRGLTAIQEVVLGPRCRMSVEVMQQKLAAASLPGVLVRKSEIPLR